MVRTGIEIIILIGVIVGAYFIYLEKAKLNQQLGFKDLEEQFLTKEITQLKLTNRKLSDSESILQKQLTKAEKTLMLIKQATKIEGTNTTYVGQIKPGNIYNLYLDNQDNQSPQLGRLLVQDMDTVNVETSELQIMSDILVSKEGNQHRVLTYSSVYSKMNNKTKVLNYPTGEVVVNLEMLERPRFRILKWHEGFQLGINTGKQGTLVKTLGKYGDVSLLGVGFTLNKPTGYVEFANLPIYKSVGSSLALFPNTNIGVGMILSEQLPVISLSFSL